MKTKIIAVNWKWDGELTTPKEYEIESLEDSLVAFTNFKREENGGKEKFIDHINRLSNGGAKVLVLSHNNTPNNISKEDLSQEIGNNQNIFIFDFKMGRDKIYLEHGGFLGAQTTFKKFEEFDIAGNIIPQDRFQNVWNHYFTDRVLEKQKKIIIDTFLPLAIDMQGLHDTTNPEYRKEYLKEVIEDIEANADSIILTWNEIKRIFALKVFSREDTLEYLCQDYRLSNDEKKNFYFPIESDDHPGLTLESLIEFFKTPAMWTEKAYIPNWLQRVVGIIDSKLSHLPNADIISEQ